MRWIRNNGAAGWHNINVTKSGTYDLKYWNLDSKEETFIFRVNANNLPRGTKVGLQDQEIRSVSATMEVSKQHQNMSAQGDIPAGYQGAVQVTIETPNGGVLPPGSSVEVALYWQVESGPSKLSGRGQAPRRCRCVCEERAG